MKLRYETGIATLIQFIVLSILNIINGLNSVITTCRAGTNDCISNMLVSIIFYMLVVGWFAFIWLLGFTAQDKRNRRMAQILIAAEALVALVAFFNAKHHPDFFSLITSLVDLALALWVIFLAWRLMKSGGGRVVTTRSSGRSRPRQRKSTARQ